MNRRGRPRLSQHFLRDPATARRIADAVRAPAGADVLEIGPGRGALTEHLLERGWRVTAIELDHTLAEALAIRWGERDDFRVVHADILTFELHPVESGSGAWHVVGNLPYAITTPVLFRMLDQIDRGPVAGMLFMVQREVAERLAAEPGTKSFGALTVTVGLEADVEILFNVEPGAFRPPPKVHSSVVRLTPHDRWGLDTSRRERVRALVRRAFGQRRKQLQKILRSLPPWRLDREATARVSAAAGIELRRRPETLAIAEWLRLDAALAEAPLEVAEEDPDPNGSFPHA